jgi:nucleotide-binding universal stress UspA family protein
VNDLAGVPVLAYNRDHVHVQAFKTMLRGQDFNAGAAAPQRFDPQGFRRILVYFDTLPEALKALQLAVSIGRIAGSHLRLLHLRLWDPYSMAGGRVYLESSGEAWAQVDQALNWVWKYDLCASGTVVESKRSDLARGILAEIRSSETDAAILSARQRLRSPGLGPRVIRQVNKGTQSPVLVVYPDG